MSPIRLAISMLTALVGPLALMLLGALFALAVYQGEGAGLDGRPIPTPGGRGSFRDDGEVVHVSLNVDRGPAGTLVLHGSGGKALAKIHVFRSGAFGLESIGTDPSPFIFHRQPCGRVGMGVGSGLRVSSVDARVDGSIELRSQGDAAADERVVTVDAAGSVRTDPSMEQF